jgi:hypothetical protein
MGLKDLTTDEILKQVAQYFVDRAAGDEEYYKSEDWWGEYEYMVRDKIMREPLSEVLRRTDDLVHQTVTKLKDLGVSEKEIKQMLIDASTPIFNESVFYSDDSIGAMSMGTEEEVQIDASDRVVKDNQGDWWDWKNVVTELESREDEDNEEDPDLTPFGRLVKVVEDQDGYYIREPEEFLNQFAEGHHNFVTLEMGDRMLEYIVDPKKFVVESKRYIKDMKILKKQGEKFPATSKVLRRLWT